MMGSNFRRLGLKRYRLDVNLWRLEHLDLLHIWQLINFVYFASLLAFYLVFALNQLVDFAD